MKDAEILKNLSVRFDAYDFDVESDHFDDFSDKHDLRTFWACYGLNIRMDKRPPYVVEGKTVVYKNHWGDLETRSKIEGPTWGDVYIAADRCIRQSGDMHHVFIESLDEMEFDENDEIELFTGS